MSSPLPPLPDDWESTRATLHAYAHAAGSVPRTLAEAHPKWWHVSLKVRPHGLVSDPVELPSGGTMSTLLDLTAHEVVVEASDGSRSAIPMTEGLTGTEMGDRVIAAAADLGLSGDYDRAKFESEEARSYDPETAERYLTALVTVAGVFERHREAIGGDVGIVQLWPHNFDLAVEWFGTRTIAYEENGETVEHPAQLNLGFYGGGAPKEPGGEPTAPYFYSNPWPFDHDALLGQPLPAGAYWHTEGWEGTMLPYATLAGDPEAEAKLADYARAVFEIASPTLLA